MNLILSSTATKVARVELPPRSKERGFHSTGLFPVSKK